MIRNFSSQKREEWEGETFVINKFYRFGSNFGKQRLGQLALEMYNKNVFQVGSFTYNKNYWLRLMVEYGLKQ